MARWSALRFTAAVALGSTLVLFAACESASRRDGIEVDLNLPLHFPAPEAPGDNPLTDASIELGRHLFYDLELSGPGTISCSGCHKQEFAFADNLAISLGADGEEGSLNAPGLANLIYARPLGWAHQHTELIEEQLLGPMFSSSPIEMGIAGNEERVTRRMREKATYISLFEQAYPGEGIDLKLARLALASFVRSLVSYQSPFDRFLAGEKAAISPDAERGSRLFYSERLGCSHCHVGFNFTTATHSQSTQGPRTSPFHNIGLYNLGGTGDYPTSAQGLITESGFDKDMGRFRVPSLRNVALTAPYGHDGSVESLEDFIRIYEAGGRVIDEGSKAGDGRISPWRSPDLKSFTLDDSERADLIAFLTSLSDASLVVDPSLATPW